MPVLPRQGRDPLGTRRRHRRRCARVAAPRVSRRSSPSTWAARPPTSATSPGDYERALDVEVGRRAAAHAHPAHPHRRPPAAARSCSFDGVRLRVGPESAGANPGPASYRRGGPLTVTDCNVLLGRIQPDFFPRCLARTAICRWTPTSCASQFASLARIAARRATTSPRSPPAASASRSRTWRTPSRRSRCSAATTSPNTRLTCFGGAAGQHACLVADALGMRSVFIHPLAGVLSAYGIGLADTLVMRQQNGRRCR